MDRKSLLLITKLRDDQLEPLAAYLLAWLRRAMGENPAAPILTESRARALLYATNNLDEPTLSDFQRRLSEPGALRVALYDLLETTGLAAVPELAALPVGLSADNALNAWLSLALTALAWKHDYDAVQLDPAAPPSPYSPAGQVVHQAAHFIRQQAQRNATERDRLALRLAYDAGQAPAPLSVGNENALPPLRPPIPVRYPEYNDPISIQPDEVPETPPAGTPGYPLVITDEDLPAEQAPLSIEVVETRPIPEPEIRVGPARPATPPAARRNLSVADVTRAVGDMAAAIGRRFSHEPLRTTQLRVVVQAQPDGPGLPGLQVKVRCQGVSKYVAATTNADGVFRCELPVRAHSGLTYHVDVTWPQEYGGKTERKSLTLNAERTEFTLPFYHRLQIKS